MAVVVRPPAARPPAAAPSAEGNGRRDAWLKAGVLFCAAALIGVLWAAALPDSEDAPPPRVEVQPKDADVLYEDQYVRIWADPPAKADEEKTEIPP